MWWCAKQENENIECERIWQLYQYDIRVREKVGDGIES